MGSGVSLARPLADALPGLIRSRKNLVSVRLPLPDSIGTGRRTSRWAASTNVRSSLAATTPANVPYGLGGVIVASAAPVAVARTTARVLGSISFPPPQQVPRPVKVRAT